MTICGVGAWEHVGVARCETSAGSLTFFTRLVVHIVSELFSFPFLSIVASVHPVTTTGTTNSHMRPAESMQRPQVAKAITKHNFLLL
jgi:hypothetical protein